MKKILEKYKSLPIQVKAGFWFLICTILQRSISIITTPIFTRMLTTSEYGKYSVFISWMGILTCFVTLYIFSGIYPQAIVKFDEEKDQYSSAMQGLTVVLVIGWLWIYLLGANYWNNIVSLNTNQMLAMFIVMWAHAVFGFWSAEQRVAYRYKILVIVTLIESIMQPVLCIILIWLSDDKVSGLVWGIAIATFVCYIALFIKQVVKGKVFFSKKIWSYALKLALPLIPHYLSVVLLNNSDRIMIQKMVGESQAGIYNVAYTISMCGVLINQALLQTLQPWFFQKIKGKEFKDIKRIAYPALCAIAVVNLMVILFTPELIKIFAPPSYYDAIWVMPPVAMSVFFMFMYNLFSTFEFYYEKTTYVSIATFIGASLNIILNLIFIKIYGYYAAGYTTLLCYIVFAIAHYLFMKRICNREIDGIKVYDIRIIFAISVAFLITGFLIMLTYYSTIVRYLLVVLVTVICLIKRKIIIDFVLSLIRTRKVEES